MRYSEPCLAHNTWWLVPLLCPLPFPHHPLIHRLTGRDLNPSLRDHPRPLLKGQNFDKRLSFLF